MGTGLKTEQDSGMNWNAEQIATWITPIVNHAVARSGRRAYRNNRYGPADVLSAAFTGAMEELAKWFAEHGELPDANTADRVRLEKLVFFRAKRSCQWFTEGNALEVTVPRGALRATKRRHGHTRRTLYLLKRCGRRSGGLLEDTLARHGIHHGRTALPMFAPPAGDDTGQQREAQRDQARQALERAAAEYTGDKVACALAIINERLFVTDRRYQTTMAAVGERFGLTADQVGSIETTLVRRARRLIQAESDAQKSPWRGDRGPDGPRGRGNAPAAIAAAVASFQPQVQQTAALIAQGRLLQPDQSRRVPLQVIADQAGCSRQAVHQLEVKLVARAMELLKGAAA
jgi:hypothetical protein